MWEDAVGCPSVDKETPVCEVVPDVDEIAGGDGVEVPPGDQFPCQLQGVSQFEALSPNRQ